MSRSFRGRFRSSSPAGTKLNQLRFVRGNPVSTDGILEQLAEKERLVYYENGDGPAEAVIERGLKNLVARQGGDRAGDHRPGPAHHHRLRGIERRSIVAYKAKRHCPPVDLSKVRAYDAADFWVPIDSPRSKSVVLDPGDFYLWLPRNGSPCRLRYAAEMEPFDQSIGDFSVHYAGFFDPGFGYGAGGEIKGTKAVLEVRAHEVPLLLEDRQIVGRLIYHRMANAPDKLYGQAIGSSYQQQGLALSKQFRALETARSAVPK